jgi:hypothetical protein
VFAPVHHCGEVVFSFVHGNFPLWIIRKVVVLYDGFVWLPPSPLLFAGGFHLGFSFGSLSLKLRVHALSFGINCWRSVCWHVLEIPRG